MTEQNQNKQSNMGNHSENEFNDIVQRGLVEGGICLIAMKNWGKSRFLMNTCKYIQSLPNVKNYIFDSSDAFLYGFNRIPVFNINENDVQLKEVKTTLDIESYEFVNWELVKLALKTENHLLIRLKSKSPSKKGYAIRRICNYLDDLQRAEKEQSPTHENKFKIAYTIDEFSDVFSNRSSLRIDSETFLGTYNQGRNFGESFFFSLLRESDGAKTLRVKALNAYGKIPESDKSPYHRRLEKQYNVNLSNMQPRTWLIEGQIIKSPDFKQSGKPFIINRALRAQYNSQQPQPQKQGFIARFMAKRKLIIQQKQLKLRQRLINSQNNNDDPSVYDYENPKATQEDDMEEDLALLNDSDMGW